MSLSKKDDLADFPIFRAGLVFELGLGLVGFIIVWMYCKFTVASYPLPRFFYSDESNVHWMNSIIYGVLFAVILLAIVLCITYVPVKPLKKLKSNVDDRIAPMFASLNVFQVILISLAAGFGEEILFRWCIQGIIEHSIDASHGWWLALMVASFVFGLCHWIDEVYAVFTMIIGLLLGGLWVYCGDLIAVIVAHSVYDFLAITSLVWLYKRRERISQAIDKDAVTPETR